MPIHSPNYWTPLTDRVDESAQQIHTINNIYNNHTHQQQATAVFDSGATSHCGMVGDPFIATDKPSYKISHLPNGDTTAASTQAKLHHQVKEPARTVDMVPGLKHNTLLSASKFADAGYTTILTPTAVHICHGNDVQQVDSVVVL